MIEIKDEKIRIEGVLNIPDIIKKIKSLPEPEIVSLDSSPLPNTHNTVLGLQREKVYANSSKSGSKIQYIGSKNVTSCILAYFYSETKHVVVHIDHTQDLDLSVILSKFNRKEKIKVTLIGGNPNPNGLEPSNNNLYITVVALLWAVQKLQLTITMVSQKLIEKNNFTQACKYQLVYDHIYYKADMLFRQLYDEPLPDDAFKSCTANDLRTKKHIKHILELAHINQLLGCAQELYDDSFISQQNLQAISEIKKFLLNTLKMNKDNFMTELEGMFSIEGFNLMDKALIEHTDVYKTSMLRHFVFDLHTKKIHVINENMKTPNANIRFLLKLDQKLKYFISYDEQWMKCELSKEFLETCSSIISTIKNNTGDSNKIATTFGISPSDTPGIYAIVKNIKLTLNQLDQKQSKQSNINTKSSLFLPNPDETAHKNKETAHNNLETQIKKMIPDKFTKHFKNFTDAIIIDKNYSKALRTACTGTNPEALELTLDLIKVLLRYKDKLEIKINEQAGPKKYSALHHAALKGNKDIYDYLIQQDADPNLEDDEKHTPKYYLDLIMSQKIEGPKK